eukprot:183574-Hanusia_phi.AAC.1
MATSMDDSHLLVAMERLNACFHFVFCAILPNMREQNNRMCHRGLTSAKHLSMMALLKRSGRGLSRIWKIIGEKSARTTALNSRKPAPGKNGRSSQLEYAAVHVFVLSLQLQARKPFKTNV